MTLTFSPSFIQTIPLPTSSSKYHSLPSFSRTRSVPHPKRRNLSYPQTSPLHPQTSISVSQPIVRASHSKQDGAADKSSNLQTSPSPSSPASSPSPLPSIPTPSIPASLALLNFTTVLWGTQHSVIKLALTDISPSTLNFTRFAIAMLLSLPGLRPFISQQQKNQSAISFQSLIQNPVVKQGLELSLYLFAGYALQSAALLTTSASRSAFLLYLNVKFVPLFGRFLYGRFVTPLTWASAAIALFGTVLLTYDGSSTPVIGDAFSIAAAAASALFILRTESAARIPQSSPAALNAITLIGVTALTGTWTVLSSFVRNFSQLLSTVSNMSVDASVSVDLASLSSAIATNLHSITSTNLLGSPQAVAAVAYLAVVTTALCNYLQTVGQRAVSAERAAIVFALDPVYGALFAWLLLGESFGGQGICGAVLIVIAAFLSGLGDKSRTREGGGERGENVGEGGTDVSIRVDGGARLEEDRDLKSWTDRSVK